MMIKFHRPSSSGSGAAEYLEDETDHKDRPRAGVAVLRGDPFRVGQIADSLDFKHRLTAGVIAWAPEDNRRLSRLTRCWTSSSAWPGRVLIRIGMPGLQCGTMVRRAGFTCTSWRLGWICSQASP